MEPIIFDRLAANEARHWWFVARRKILSDIIRRKVTGRAPLRVLEAGCGTGGNLDMLKDFGAVQAFEPDEMALGIARSRGSADVRKGHLPDGNPFDGPFDMIALLDVVEHLDDDLGALQALSKVLARDGTFLIAVPAFRFLWSRHDELHHHKRRYEREELLQLAERAGLEVKYCSYFNTFLFPVLVLRRLIGRLRPQSLGADDEMPGRTLNDALTAIFQMERYFLRWVRFPFGASLVMIAGKAGT